MSNEILFTSEDVFEDLSQAISFIMSSTEVERQFHNWLTRVLKDTWVVFEGKENIFKLPFQEAWDMYPHNFLVSLLKGEAEVFYQSPNYNTKYKVSLDFP